MDYLSKKELNGLKGDIKASQYAIEAEKYTFQKKLIEKIGPEMIEELNNPKPKQEQEIPKKRKCFLLRIFNKKKGD